MKNEIWKDVAGYEGLYQVSSEGRVKGLERTFIDNSERKRTVKERILKPITNHYGYQVVNLYTGGGKPKRFYVHRLVCEAFHENPENKLEVNHINEIKIDNRAVNLEWSTRRENLNYGTRNERIAKANSKPVAQYTKDGAFIKAWASAAEVKRQLGFNHSNIIQVAKGNRKTACGYRWEYV